MKLKNKRKAFTLLELVFVVAVSSFIFNGLIYTMKNAKEDKELSAEILFNVSIKGGVQSSFINIIEAYTEASVDSITDGSDNWGWDEVEDASPYPAYSLVGGVGGLTYSLDNTEIDADALQNLQNTIVNNFRGTCYLDGAVQANGNIRLVCPRLNNMTYSNEVGLNQVRGHILGSPINPTNAPNILVSFWREYPTTELARSQEEYTFSMQEVYIPLRNNSLRKLNDMKTAIEAFTYRTKMREVSNSVSSGGLHTMDDEFVPWVWKIFGDDTALVNDSICNKGVADTVCDNLDDDTIWRTALDDRGLLITRLIDNVLIGDMSYAVDGFNNPIYVYPLLSQCPIATDDINDCVIIAEQAPQDNYLNIGNPPFITAIYSRDFGDKTAILPNYARIYIAH